MNRQDLKYAYSELNTSERRELADIMGCTMSNLYRYCMKPYSNHIGKERYEKLLKFKDLNLWMSLANEGRKNKDNNKKESILTISFGEMIPPDIVMIGKQKYIKE